MVRRIALAALWFVSAWMTYGLVAYFLGLPDRGGAVVGALLAAFVFMDPTGQLSARSDRLPAKTTRAPATSPPESVAEPAS
jgi:hypothetical protein